MYRSRKNRATSIYGLFSTDWDRSADAEKSKCNPRRLLYLGDFGSCVVSALVYGWFTEGFDMVDLKEAKALLDELS